MIRFLVNPAAGRGSGKAQLDRLRILASSLDAGLVVSKGVADLVEQARRAAADGVLRLVVAGGDGTMHYAAQGLAETSCALGVVPLGSGNDLAGTLGVPADLNAAVARALSGPVRRIDMLRVSGSLAVAYAGVGFDSEVTQLANRVRHLRGPLIYPYAVLRTLVSFRPPAISVTYDGGSFSGRAMFAVAANLPRFGGGMRIAPDADVADGMLDLVIVREISRATLLRVFPKVYAGRHLGHPAVTLVRTSRAEIGIDREMKMYGGGEPLVTVEPGRPAVIEILPGALAVVG